MICLKRTSSKAMRVSGVLRFALSPLSQLMRCTFLCTDRGLLIANVHEEMQGKEAKLCRHHHTSRVLETVLAGSTLAQLRGFYAALKER